MPPIRERIADFSSREVRTREELEGLKAELRVADTPTLVESATALNAPEVKRLTTDEQTQLLGTHKLRLTELALSGHAGVYHLSGERIRENQYKVLKRETAGLFPATLPDPVKMQQQVDTMVAKAQANATGTPPSIIDPQKFGGVAQHLLGINSGPDQISEASVVTAGSNLEFDAFDRAGFHVMFGRVSASGDAVYVNNLKATHGRNVEDLSYGHGEQKLPGRGNSRAISEALSAATDAALANGFSALECTPGSDEVAALYAKMGFKRTDGVEGPEAFKRMRLDLKDVNAVRQMVFVFTASRIGLTDVPKTVSDKALATGRVLSPPNRTLLPIDFKARTNFLLESDGSVAPAAETVAPTAPSVSP